MKPNWLKEAVMKLTPSQLDTLDSKVARKFGKGAGYKLASVSMRSGVTIAHVMLQSGKAETITL